MPAVRPPLPASDGLPQRKMEDRAGGGRNLISQDATEIADRKREADGAAAASQEGRPSGLWPTWGMLNTPGATSMIPPGHRYLRQCVDNPGRTPNTAVPQSAPRQTHPPRASAPASPCHQPTQPGGPRRRPASRGPRNRPAPAATRPRTSISPVVSPPNLAGPGAPGTGTGRCLKPRTTAGRCPAHP